MSDLTQARPFLKWVGGKAQLEQRVLAQIDKLVPGQISIYTEPFVGAGAIFFALARERRFERAVLSDSNQELITTYTAIRDEVEGVIRSLKALLRKPLSEEEYYRVRALRPAWDSAVAARMIYLNKTCYNGLYRVNKKGEFNTPVGRFKTPPKVLDEEALRAASLALQGVSISCTSWKAVSYPVKVSALTYFDPPYVPVTASSDFTAYQKEGFAPTEQEELAAFVRRRAKLHGSIVLSNSYCKITRKLYAGLQQQKIAARRSINSKATARGPVKELLVISRFKKGVTA